MVLPKHNCKKGFTLAELLVVLAVLGIIATFSIPKMLNNQANVRNKALAKETASILSDAYMMYRTEHVPSNTTQNLDLIPYINYVKRDETSTVDSSPAHATGFGCSSTNPCLVLPNGVVLWFYVMHFYGCDKWQYDRLFSGY